MIYEPDPNVNTMLDAMQKTVRRIPDHDMFGERTGDGYKWYSFKQIDDLSKAYSIGMRKLDLAPAQEYEDKIFRFMVILSSN